MLGNRPAYLFVAALSLFFVGNFGAAASDLTVLYEFSGSPDGSDPTGGVVVDPNTGVLYGTTKYGGSGNGTVFSLRPPKNGTGEWTPKIIYTFAGGGDGSAPSTGLAIDVDPGSRRELWGTTDSGPPCPSQCGTVFDLVNFHQHTLD
jgi:hypothetical protein